jgi:hypothetical protein
MARGTSKRLASVRSEIAYDFSKTNVMKLDEWYAWKDLQRKNGTDDWDKIEAHDKARRKYIKQREEAEKAERRKNKEAKKESTKTEYSRIEGLSKSLVSELQPQERALAQRMFDGEKNAQAVQNLYAQDNPTSLSNLKDGDTNSRITDMLAPRERSYGRSYESQDGTSVTLLEKNPFIQYKWIEEDKEASRALEQRLIAEGKNVQTVPSWSSTQKYLIVKNDNAKYPTTYAVPIIAYKQKDKVPTDADLMKSSKDKASQIISSYASKLVKKTEELVGTGGEFKGSPKVTLNGNDPWRESRVEVVMGGKKITWNTKMIWNVSKLDNSFNQFPTRLVSQEDA